MNIKSIAFGIIVLLVGFSFASQEQNLSDCTLAVSVIKCTKNNINVAKEKIDKLIQKKCYEYYNAKVQETSLLLAVADCEIEVRKILEDSVESYFKNISNKK